MRWVALALLLVGCGPTILKKRAVEAPPAEALRPGPSAEESAGEVPTLIDLDPAFPLVPDGFEAPPPPDDPRPLVLLEADVEADGADGADGADTDAPAADEAGAEAGGEGDAGDEAIE